MGALKRSTRNKEKGKRRRRGDAQRPRATPRKQPPKTTNKTTRTKRGLVGDRRREHKHEERHILVVPLCRLKGDQKRRPGTKTSSSTTGPLSQPASSTRRDSQSWSPGKQQVMERWATAGRVHPRNDLLLVHMTTALVFNW